MTTRIRVFFSAWAGLVLLNSASGTAGAGEEPPVQGEGKTLAYLTGLHARVHRAWAESFLAMAAAKLPKDHPVNLSTRAVVLELVLAPGGRLVNVEVSVPSGASEFDSSALDVVRENVPYGSPPADELSDDGNLHVLWTFARDDRRCSGLQVKYAQRPLADAVRGLVEQDREDVALRRLQAADDEARAQAFPAFASAWLERASVEQGLAVAPEGAAGGDRGAGAKLHQAITEGRAAALAKDRSVPEAKRLAAVRVLGTRDDAEAEKVLHALIKDSAPAIRAAALLAGIRPGAGRGAVFMATGLLTDPSPEVRGAAAAALLRAGGEPMVAQVFRTLKEKDPRPGELVAQQLGSMKGEASAEMLGKLVRAKFDRRVRLMSAWALARRTDDPAVKLLASLGGDPDPELRFLACAGADPQKRLAAASVPEGKAWRKSYLVLAGGRGRLLALDWALAQFPRLDPAARVEIMTPWLSATKREDK